MNKVVRDGLVAVIYSPDYGAGWYSWHDIQGLLFDPVLVDMIENTATPEAIEEYCHKTYDCGRLLGCNNLDIVWIPEGTEFLIEEYDGSETIRFKEKQEWVTA
jgi:hypothetical protein